MSAPRASMGRISPAPIGGETTPRSTNQMRGHFDGPRAVPERNGDRREASGSGDFLLSDARRPGSCPGPRLRAQRRRGLDGAGPEASSLEVGPPRRDLTPEAGSRVQGRCGGGLRPEPQVPLVAGRRRSLPLSPSSHRRMLKREAGVGAYPALAFSAPCTSCSYSSSRFSVGRAMMLADRNLGIGLFWFFFFLFFCF